MASAPTTAGSRAIGLRGSRSPPRRWHHSYGRRGEHALRFDVEQADLPRPRLRDLRAQGASCGRGHPHPRGGDQHLVPAGGAGGPDFTAGRLNIAFITEDPHLLTARSSADRGTRLLEYLAHVTVNQSHGPRPTRQPPLAKLPPVDLVEAPPSGSSDLLRALKPMEFSRRLRSQEAVAVTDTTFRDAHQSLLATRVRTRDLVDVAGHVAHLTPQLLKHRGLGRGDLRRRTAPNWRRQPGRSMNLSFGTWSSLASSPADLVQDCEHSNSRSSERRRSHEALGRVDGAAVSVPRIPRKCWLGRGRWGAVCEGRRVL